MLINIRRNVFETNSSSVHSLSISGNIDKLNYDICTEEEKIKKEFESYFGEYGWGYEVLTTSREKISYYLTHLATKVSNMESLKDLEEFKKFENLFKEKTGCDLLINPMRSEFNPMGYIDHQSLDEIFANYNTSPEEIIFNDTYSIVIDNDNQ